MNYRTILLKLSGELLAAETGSEDSPREGILADLAKVHQAGVRVGIVVGGGNLLRGAVASRGGMDRATADAVGMLGTLINALILKDALLRNGVDAEALSAVRAEPLVERYSRQAALEHLEKGRVLILGGGTGNPYLTTDTAAALRAAEIGADALLKATKVGGVYAADPVLDPKAERFDRLTYTDVLERRLEVMDAAAVSICRETGIPIIVFDGSISGNLQRVISGETVGTVVGGEDAQ